MSKVVVFQKDGGGVSIFHPNPAALEVASIEVIAPAVVPAGKPFKIVDFAELPPDRNQRMSWTVDVMDLTDGVGQMPVLGEQQ